MAPAYKFRHSSAYAYDPYGAPLQAAAPITDRGYAGMLTEPNSGLGLTLYRAYNPAIGRWLSRDPAGEATDQSLNLYAYVNANPINAHDPLGLCPNKNGKPGGPGSGNPGQNPIECLGGLSGANQLELALDVAGLTAGVVGAGAVAVGAAPVAIGAAVLGAGLGFASTIVAASTGNASDTFAASVGSVASDASVALPLPQAVAAGGARIFARLAPWAGAGLSGFLLYRDVNNSGCFQ